MNDKPPLTATVALVEFDQGPGLRIDIVIGWDRLKGLAQQIRWWSRSPASEQSSEQTSEQSDKTSEQSSEQSPADD